MERISQKSFRLRKKIKDPKFEINRLEFYSLSLYIGLSDFQILITDTETNQCVLMEDYLLDPKLEDAEKPALIKLIFDDHHLLLANFWKAINIIIKNRVFTFVPKKLYSEDKISNYLKINSLFKPSQDKVMLTYHEHLDVVNIFCVPKSIVGLASKFYPGKKVRFIHQSSSLINGVVSINKSGNKDIVIFIDRFGLHILIVNDKKLIFYNQYLIKKFTDYMRFIKIVANELKFDPIKDKIMLYGYLGKNTPHFNKLKKTMRQLTFGNRPENLNFGYVFDEVLEHQYFDLFSSDTSRD